MDRFDFDNFDSDLQTSFIGGAGGGFGFDNFGSTETGSAAAGQAKFVFQ